MAAEDLAVDALPIALRLPLAHSHLIEASAGSGKTWTLVTLFVRLVVEAGYGVDQVLTVTFTHAACAELRQRIRQRLIDLREALAGGAADALALRLLSEDGARAMQRVRAAIAGLDGAAIYTIHGFAARALKDRAFSAAMPFDVELAADTEEIWKQAVLDFWRAHVVQCSPTDGALGLTHRDFVAKLLRHDSPERWMGWLLRVRFAAHARLAGGVAEQILDVQTLVAEHAQLAAMWHEERQTIVDLLLTHPALSRRSYNQHNVPRWCAVLDDYLLSATVQQVPKELHYFSPAGMQSRLKSPEDVVPVHPFWLVMERFLAVVEAYQRGFLAWRQQLLRRAYGEVTSMVRERLAERQVLGFDDLIMAMDGALHGARGARLAHALRQRFPAALIDEFQDTDAIQERIFAAIYPIDLPNPKYFVGDPKQAIYRFRGADLYTYLGARQGVSACHELRDNYRASASLLAALNLIYAQAPQAFRHPAIAYSAMRCAADARRPVLDEDDPSCVAALRVIVPQDAQNPKKTAEVASMAAQAVAVEVAQLLTKARQQRIRIGPRALAGSDIAVLVNSNAQGRLMRDALRRLGVGAADRSRASVYTSEEAQWLLLLLLACAESHRPDRLKNALATPLFGWSAQAVLQLADDALRWQQQVEAFGRYQRLWQRRGVLRLLRTLLAESGGAALLAQSADGERHLTNLFHLGELMQAQADRGQGLLAQCLWLAERHAGHVNGGEAAELRLESDQDLVQVLTIHKAKGLEFPLVFVPFMYAGHAQPVAGPAGPKSMPLVYHDANGGQELVIDFGSPDYAQAAQWTQQEALAEEARLLYVALTRAIYRCVVFFSTTPSAASAPLTWLLQCAEGPIDNERIRSALADLARQSAGTLALTDLAEPAGRADRQSEHATFARRAALQLHAPVPSAWQLASFSSLQQQDLAAYAIERPDHDRQAQAVGEALLVPVPAEDAAAERFRFARGARAGECLHAILEGAGEGAGEGEVFALERTHIARQLVNHGFQARLAPAVAAWLEEVFDTPLQPDDLTLRSVRAEAQIREMEFHLPLMQADWTQLVSIGAAHQVSLPTLAAQQVDGFLKGFIDLVVCHQGRFYVIDYKSNWLGGQFEDYQGATLEEAMHAGGYVLQYLIYSVALVRWLRWRQPSFDYARDFGGVRYLFLRGMHPRRRDTRGQATGVYAVRPSEGLIQALDGLLAGQRG